MGQIFVYPIIDIYKKNCEQDLHDQKLYKKACKAKRDKEIDDMIERTKKSLEMIQKEEEIIRKCNSDHGYSEHKIFHSLACESEAVMFEQRFTIVGNEIQRRFYYGMTDEFGFLPNYCRKISPVDLSNPEIRQEIFNIARKKQKNSISVWDLIDESSK